MQPEWNKIDLGPSISGVTSGLEIQLQALKSQLEAETKKIQNLVDIFSVEIQKLLDTELNK